MCSTLIVLCVIFSVHSVLADIPSYIKPCSLKDPKFDQCCLDQGKAALPHLLKGDKKFGIPVLNPLTLPVVEVDAGRELKIKLTNLKVFGIEGAQLNTIKIDVAKRSGLIEVFIPNIQLIGTYDIDGRILVLPITGQGPINITGIDGNFSYKLNYELIDKKGVKYVKLLPEDHLDFKVTRAYFNLQNLFNGDERLGPEMNKFLNENWTEVIKELGGPVEQTIVVIIRTIADNIFKRAPYHDLFLD